MRLLLVSTYEMGHQPLHLAAPAAALRAAPPYGAWLSEVLRR